MLIELFVQESEHINFKDIEEQNVEVIGNE